MEPDHHRRHLHHLHPTYPLPPAAQPKQEGLFVDNTQSLITAPSIHPPSSHHQSGPSSSKLKHQQPRPPSQSEPQPQSQRPEGAPRGQYHDRGSSTGQAQPRNRTGHRSSSNKMTNRKSSGGKKKHKAKQRKQNVSPLSILQPVDTNKTAGVPDDAPVSATSSENSKGLIDNVEFACIDLNLSSANTESCREKFVKKHPDQGGVDAEEGDTNNAASGPPDSIITPPPVELPLPEPNTPSCKSMGTGPVSSQTLNQGSKLDGDIKLLPDTDTAAEQERGEEPEPVRKPEKKPVPLFEMATPVTQTDAPNGVAPHDPAYTEAIAAPPPEELEGANVARDDDPSGREETDGSKPNEPCEGHSSPPSSPPSHLSNGGVFGDVHSHTHAHAEPTAGIQALGLRWAPLNVPFARRLQTLVVLAHCLSLAITTSIFFFVCVNPLMWPIIIAYLIKISVSTAHCDGTLSRRSNLARRLPIWKLFASYFPARLHKTADLPPTRKYIFGYHPHGIISHGAWAAFATETLGFSQLFPGITNTLLTLDSNFRIPLYRDYILTMGLGSVSKESIVNTLTNGGRNGEGMGRAVTIVVGGAREALEARPGSLSLILQDRKGFIRMAMRTGADLVPVVGFGENELYTQLYHRDHPLVRKVQMWVLRVLKFTLPILRGRGIFNYDVGMMPFRHPMNVVVGYPIKVDLAPKDRAPDNDEVDRLHGEYIAELERLWHAYKDRFAKNRTSELKVMA